MSMANMMDGGRRSGRVVSVDTHKRVTLTETALVANANSSSQRNPLLSILPAARTNSRPQCMLLDLGYMEPLVIFNIKIAGEQ